MTSALDNVRLALGTFVQNPLRSFLTLLGIVIGVATVVSMMALIEGLRLQMNRDLADLGANGFQVQKMPQGFGNFDFEKLSKRPDLTLQDLSALAAACPSVLAAAGESFEGGQRLSTAVRETRPAVGVWAGTPEYFQTNAVSIARGRPFNAREFLDGRRVVVLGADVVDALFPGMDPVGQTVRIRQQPFLVVGTLERRGGFMRGGQDNQALIPLSVFFDLFGRNRSIAISMQAVSADRLLRAQDEVRAVLRSRRRVAPLDPDNFELFSNESATQMLNNLSQTVTAASFGVCLLSLIVGGIGILNIMLVAVTERTREIGLRKALGARKGRILAQFATEAVTLALVGGVAGILLGVGLAGLARWLFALPAQVPLWAVLVSVGMSSGVGLVFGIYPAARAAALDPVEAMRAD